MYACMYIYIYTCAASWQQQQQQQQQLTEALQIFDEKPVLVREGGSTAAGQTVATPPATLLEIPLVIPCSNTCSNTSSNSSRNTSSDTL